MQLPHISHIAAFSRLFQQMAHIVYFFPHKLAFLTAVFTFFIFLFESITFDQHQHW